MFIIKKKLPPLIFPLTPGLNTLPQNGDKEFKTYLKKGKSGFVSPPQIDKGKQLDFNLFRVLTCNHEHDLMMELEEKVGRSPKRRFILTETQTNKCVKNI